MFIYTSSEVTINKNCVFIRDSVSKKEIIQTVVEYYQHINISHYNGEYLKKK